MNRKEYNIAVEEYADRLYRFAVKTLRNEMDARDVVQEVFAKVWVKHEEIDYTKVKSYLFTSAYHTMLDWMKKEKRSGDIVNYKETGVDQYVSHDLKDVLDEALTRLPEVQRTLVLLRDYEGYSYSDISEITELSEAQVKVYIFRARQALKDYIKRLDLVI